MTREVYVGVDLGGTALKVGVCDGEGRLLYKDERPTGIADGVNAVLDRIAEAVRDAADASGAGWERVAGVGAGIPGFLDIPNGHVKWSVNLGWRDVPVASELSRRLGVPVVINNDANVAALGEAWSGAGAGIPDVVCYTLGTGVGGGIVVGGRLVEGCNGMAGEFGHMRVVPDLEAVQCNCGQKGCLETVSSATGIVRMARDALERGSETSLASLEKISAKDVFDAAKAGDEVARRIVARAALYLGKSMATVAVVVNPRRFIIGGGVSKAGEFFIAQVRESFVRCAPAAASEGVDVVAALHGNDAGVIGAAGLLLRR